jgi:steroid delta-isomerase-like uncharacterized protein
MATAGELLDQIVGTFNEAQWAAAEALWAPDGVWEEIGTGRTLNVAEGIAAAKDWRTAFPDVRGTIENRIVAGNQAAGEIVWRGTNTGPLMGQPATGKPIAVRAVAVFTEAGGKVARMRHYLDIAGMMAQLGTAPGGPG